MNGLSSEHAGVIVFAAATIPQEVPELARLGNGAFTKAVIDGLRGKADLFTRKRITVSSLGTYVENQVPILTGDRQQPVVIRPGGPDFPLALLK